jgi:hypothetical protein
MVKQKSAGMAKISIRLFEQRVRNFRIDPLVALKNEGLTPSTNNLLLPPTVILYLSSMDIVVCIISLKSGLGYSSAFNTLTRPLIASLQGMAPINGRFRQPF